MGSFAKVGGMQVSRILSSLLERGHDGTIAEIKATGEITKIFCHNVFIVVFLAVLLGRPPGQGDSSRSSFGAKDDKGMIGWCSIKSSS